MRVEIINATDIVSINVTNTITTYVTNTISTNVVSTVSLYSDDKKVRYNMDYYILHTVLLVIMLFIITIICYHYTKHRSKQKNFATLTI